MRHSWLEDKDALQRFNTTEILVEHRRREPPASARREATDDAHDVGGRETNDTLIVGHCTRFIPFS